MDNYKPPWWYSGANCLAAAAWLCFFAFLFLVSLGYVERDTVAGLVAVLLFFVALLASMWNQSRKKQ